MELRKPGVIVNHDSVVLRERSVGDMCCQHGLGGAG